MLWSAAPAPGLGPGSDCSLLTSPACAPRHRRGRQRNPGHRLRPPSPVHQRPVRPDESARGGRRHRDLAGQSEPAGTPGQEAELMRFSVCPGPGPGPGGGAAHIRHHPGEAADRRQRADGRQHRQRGGGRPVLRKHRRLAALPPVVGRPSLAALSRCFFTQEPRRRPTA